MARARARVAGHSGRPPSRLAPWFDPGFEADLEATRNPAENPPLRTALRARFL